MPIQGTWAEAYLRGRGLTPSRALTRDLLFVSDLDYWGYADAETKKLTHIATLPGMVALVREGVGEQVGIHQTFIDPNEPRKWRPTGDAKRNKAKKFRGSPKGGLIRLGMMGETLAIAEGIEKILGWRQLGYGPEDVSIASALSLGNLAGASTGSVDHPTLVNPETGKPLRIRNGEPDMSQPGLALPEGVKELIIVVDSTSEPIGTRASAMTAARRYRAMGLTVSLQMSPPGMDFDELALLQQRELERTA